jgi:putative phosphoribosyl transferase
MLLFAFHTLGVSHGLRKQSSAMIFENRTDAGKQLAAKLTQYASDETRVLALPRGGVPVAFEVAVALHAPLDVFIVRKLGAPGREELAIGAIASGGVQVLNEDTIAILHIDDATIEAIATRERDELRRRESVYRDDVSAQDVTDRTVILIDDGLATGASMHAAVVALRRRSPRSIVVAVPLAPEETCAQIARYADDILCLAMPQPFRGVGAWYGDFRQVSDEEVRALLLAAAQYEKTPYDRRA